MLVLLVTRVGREYLPHSDIATIDLRVRDVFSGDPPLVGAYSRYGWNHPGPLLFYVLAPLSGLTGGEAWATLIGAAFLQGIAIALSARLAWRRGGLSLTLLVLAAISLAMHAIGPRLLLDAWNPHVAVPFLALFVLQVWSVTLGDRWQLVGAAVVGTFLVQTHIGYAPLVAAGAVYAIVLAAVEQRRRHQGSWTPWARPTIVAVVACVLLWIPPVIEELTTDPGNLTSFARYARASADKGIGLSDGAGLLAAEFRVPPPWLGGEDLVEPLTNAARPASLGWLAAPVVLLIAGALATRRRSVRGAGRLVGLVALLTGVGLVALANLEPPTHGYLFYWRLPLAAFVVVAAAWPFVASSRLPGRARVVQAGLLVAAVGYGSVTLAWDVGRHTGRIGTAVEDVTASLLRQVEAAGIPGRPVLLRNPSTGFNGLHAALVDELDRRGHDVRVDLAFDFLFGASRTATMRDVEEVWYVAGEGRDVSLLTALPDARVIARTTPLTRSEERELVRLQRSLAAALERAGRPELIELLEYGFLVTALEEVPGLDRDAIDRVDELDTKVARSGGYRTAVIAFRPAPGLPPNGWQPR